MNSHVHKEMVITRHKRETYSISSSSQTIKGWLYRKQCCDFRGYLHVLYNFIDNLSTD